MASLFRMVTVNNEANILYSWSCSLLIVAACKAPNRGAVAADRYQAEGGPGEAQLRPWSHAHCLEGESSV